MMERPHRLGPWSRFLKHGQSIMVTLAAGISGDDVVAWYKDGGWEQRRASVKTKAASLNPSRRESAKHGTLRSGKGVSEHAEGIVYIPKQ